jgi:hypothetical protein
LAFHLLLTGLLAWHAGPAFDSGGEGSGSGCVLNTAWSERAEDGAVADRDQPVDVRFVEMIAAVPVPEPAPAPEVFPTTAPPAVDALPASAVGSVPDVATEPGPQAGRRAGSSPGADDRRFFSLELGGGGAQPLSIVFVIDQSSSMHRHDASDVARRELLRTLNGLSSADRFQIVLYNTSPTAITLPGGPLTCCGRPIATACSPATSSAVPWWTAQSQWDSRWCH